MGLLQISIRLVTPSMTHSFSNLPYEVSGIGILIRPCLSISHSVAAEKKKRVKARASFFG